MPDRLHRFKAQVFQALAHPTRVALVEALAAGEQTAGRLMTLLGLEQANASQHLAVLRSKQIVTSRREGNQIYYSLRDPVLADVLALLRKYFFTHLSETLGMLEEMESAERTTTA